MPKAVVCEGSACTIIARGTRVVDLCPVPQFAAALASLEDDLPNAVEQAGGAHLLADHFRDVHGQTECAPLPAVNWQPVSKPIIINAGVGTTGTRSISCIASWLGLRVLHYGPHLFPCTEKGLFAFQPFKGCDAMWSQYDFVSDSPVPSQLHLLLASHLDSPVMLSVRDPKQWRARRLVGLPTWAPEWKVEMPCGGPDDGYSVKLSSPKAEREMLVYSAWAGCIAKRRPWLHTANVSAWPLSPGESPPDESERHESGNVVPINLFTQNHGLSRVRRFLRSHMRRLQLPRASTRARECAMRVLNSSLFDKLGKMCARDDGWCLQPQDGNNGTQPDARGNNCHRSPCNLASVLENSLQMLG